MPICDGRHKTGGNHKHTSWHSVGHFMYVRVASRNCTLACFGDFDFFAISS